MRGVLLLRRGGRASRAHLSWAIPDELVGRARVELGRHGASEGEGLDALGRVAERLLGSDTPGYEAFRRRVTAIAGTPPVALQRKAVDIVVRFMRTLSFLVRFVDLRPDTRVEELLGSPDRCDGSRASLAERIETFAELLGRGVEQERATLIEALRGIQTWAIAMVERLRSGGAITGPGALVASSVMGEGVDLHRECRHVIHHDLDWVPSTIEQRTGRLDRIGSKGLRTKMPVVVYEPYLSGTHDEKMYRVMKDCARWFGVVMGDEAPLDERSTEHASSRVPLPAGLAERLAMKLAL